MKRSLSSTSKNKTIFVKFDTTKVEQEWLQLQDTNYELYKRIKNTIKTLKINPWRGTFIKNYKTKKEFKRFWKYSNLWKYPLTKKKGGMRLIYTIKESDVIIVNIIIEWGAHDKYKKL